MYQDSHKFLWFTSDAGVVKYDGTNFTVYRKKDGVSSNDVVRIKEDSKGRVWFFNYNGTVNYYYNNKIYNGENSPFLNLLTGKGFYLDFYTDSNQTIFFYNWEGELASLDINNKVSKSMLLRNLNIPLELGTKIELRVSYLGKNTSNEWMTWTNQGIFIQKDLKGKIETLDNRMSSVIVLQAKNNTYFSTAYNYKDAILKLGTNLELEKIPFPGNTQKIRTILEDSEGYLWIAALDEGVYCLKNNKIVRHFDIRNALGLLQDHEHNIWVSTQSDGIYVINHKILTQNHFDRSYFNNSGVNLLCNYPGKGIWCLNSKEVFLFGKDNSFYNLAVPKVIQPLDIIYLFANKTLLLGTKISGLSVLENITLNKGSKQIVYSKQTFFPILMKKIISDRSGLNDSVELFNIDGDSLFLLKDHTFYNLTKAFINPITLQIKKVLYQDSTLYLSTLKDVIICYNPSRIFSGNQVSVKPLNIRFNNINDILIIKDTLFVASDDGLTIIPEASLLKNIAPPPIPYFRSITVNDKIYSLPINELTLTGKNNIQLSFGCISYVPGSATYSYMLEGAGNKWITGIGSDINLFYRNLPPGNYKFKLRVKKSDSGWSKSMVLPIIIKPTLIEYPAFWAFLALIAVLIILFIGFRLKNQRIRKIEIDHQLVVLEQKALQSMMNPHFIFNSLGSIQNYLLKNKGSEAIIYLSDFARLIRQNLNAVNTPLIQLQEEVERITNYLNLEKIRLEDKFDFRIEIDPELEEDEVFIPSMIIQPIVENSIWHGIASLQEQGYICISFKTHNSKSLKIAIEDNGIGMKQSDEYSKKDVQRKHLGMTIIRKRLELLGKKYNTDTSISYSEISPDTTHPGTLAELIVPFTYTTSES